VADEYNNPSTTLDQVLGLQSRTAVRDAFGGSRSPSSTFTPMDPEFGSDSMELVGPLSLLQLNGAQQEGLLQSSSPGITLNKYGRGTAIAYAFFPGLQYAASADNSAALGFFDPAALPSGWGDLQRQVAVEPAVLAGTSQPVVVSTPGVEADLLKSDRGDAIVLLNWTDKPLSQLTITVPNAAAFQRIRSAQGVDLQTQVNAGGSLTITLPIQNVDVLMLDEAATTTTLTASPDPSTFGQSVTFTATVAGAGGIPTGTVTFMDSSTILGTGTLNNGTATFSTAALTAANHSITAVYSGDEAEFNASSSVALMEVVNPTGLTPASPPSLHTPVGPLMVFAFGIVNNQLAILFVDQKGQIFDEAFAFSNFFSPSPGNAQFLNTDMVLRNMSGTDALGFPAVVGNLLDIHNQDLWMITVPVDFMSPTALDDVITALLASGA
jgi:hypothetical protein